MSILSAVKAEDEKIDGENRESLISYKNSTFDLMHNTEMFSSKPSGEHSSLSSRLSNCSRTHAHVRHCLV